jgi:hypothetical protein
MHLLTRVKKKRTVGTKKTAWKKTKKRGLLMLVTFVNWFANALSNHGRCVLLPCPFRLADPLCSATRNA